MRLTAQVGTVYCAAATAVKARMNGIVGSMVGDVLVLACFDDGCRWLMIEARRGQAVVISEDSEVCCVGGR